MSLDTFQEARGFSHVRLHSIRSIKSLFNPDFDAIPGIELSNFAVNSLYKEKHDNEKKLGVIIFNYFVLEVCKRIAELSGARVLYIFALPYKRLLHYYSEELCFSRLNSISERRIHKKIKPRYDKSCIFMYRTF